MAKLKIKQGTTSKVVRVFLQDSSSASGAGLTGLTNASSGLTAYYIREGDATSTAIALVAGTAGTWSSGGFKELDATNLPGVYELGLPNTVLASGQSSVVMLKGAANLAPCVLELELDQINYQDGVRAGLTALPNAAAGALGGLQTPVVASGTAQAGSATTITLAVGSSATTDLFKGNVVQIISGTGAGQARVITGYSSLVATVSRAWVVNPDNTSNYTIVANPHAALDTNLAVSLNLAQAIPNTPTQGTIGDALLAAEADGVGKWTLVNTTLTLYRHDGTTVVRTFTLDSAAAPTQRV